jgi:exportin-1
LIASELATLGIQAINHYTIKRYKGMKKETLRMINTFISKSEDVNMITQNFIPPLIDILEDYNNSPVDGR